MIRALFGRSVPDRARYVDEENLRGVVVWNTDEEAVKTCASTGVSKQGWVMESIPNIVSPKWTIEGEEVWGGW